MTPTILAQVFTMMTPELLVSVSGFAITFGTMIYKFGKLEGTIVTRLNEHDRRLDHIDPPLSRTVEARV